MNRRYAATATIEIHIPRKRFSYVCTLCIRTLENCTTSPACDSHTCANECFSGGRRRTAKSCNRESWQRVASAPQPFATDGRWWQQYARSSTSFPSLEPLILRWACASGLSLAGFRLLSSTLGPPSSRYKIRGPTCYLGASFDSDNFVVISHNMTWRKWKNKKMRPDYRLANFTSAPGSSDTHRLRARTCSQAAHPPPIS